MIPACQRTSWLNSESLEHHYEKEKALTALTVNLYYTGTNGSARKFAEETVSSGTVAEIRAEEGNLRYDYFFPIDDPETVLLIDSWCSQAAIDAHHASPMMARIAALRENYDLHMKAERYVSADTPEAEKRFIRE